MNGGIDPNREKFSPILEREKRYLGNYMRAKIRIRKLWIGIVVLSILNLTLSAVIVGIVLRSLGKGG